MEEPLVQALDAVRSYVAGREPLSDTLLQVARIATSALRADMAGLTLLYPDGQARTAVSTSDEADELDQAQYDSNRGPCLEAFRTKAQLRVDDTSTDRRWPEYAAVAVAHKVRSSLSSPLIVVGDGIGALNLYSSEPRHFDDDDADDLAIYASQAAVALANAQAYWEQASLAEGLATAMQSRATIEQAKGVIMAMRGVPEHEAFEVLRKTSQDRNVKVRELAHQIVTGVVTREEPGRA